MRVMTVNLPDDLHENAIEVAASKKLSMDELITIALTQSLSRLVRDPELEARTARASGKGISGFLAQVPGAEPSESDKLPEGYQRKEELERRAQRGNLKKFESAMAKVPSVPPVPGDEL